MPQLSIVVPTFNELGNVTELRDRIAAALPGVDWELIFVDDDSPDGTAERLAALAQQDRRVRCMLRRPTSPAQPNLEALLRGMGLSPSLVRISVENGGRVLLLRHADVVFIRTEERRVMVHTRDAHYPHHGLGTLDRLEEKLAALSFFRANRGELVNLAQVRDFAPWFNGKYMLTMRDNAATEITVSKARVREFRDQLGLA